jgi:hypothetical protein
LNYGKECILTLGSKGAHPVGIIRDFLINMQVDRLCIGVIEISIKA